MKMMRMYMVYLPMVGIGMVFISWLYYMMLGGWVEYRLKVFSILLIGYYVANIFGIIFFFSFFFVLYVSTSSSWCKYTVHWDEVWGTGMWRRYTILTMQIMYTNGYPQNCYFCDGDNVLLATLLCFIVNGPFSLYAAIRKYKLMTGTIVCVCVCAYVSKQLGIIGDCARIHIILDKG